MSNIYKNFQSIMMILGSVMCCLYLFKLNNLLFLSICLTGLFLMLIFLDFCINVFLVLYKKLKGGKSNE